MQAQFKSSDDSSHKPEHGSSEESDHTQLLSPAGTALTTILYATNYLSVLMIMFLLGF